MPMKIPDRDALEGLSALLGSERDWEQKAGVADIRALHSRLAAGEEGLYKEFEIPKGKGKVRPICAPVDETLWVVQDDILQVLNACRLPDGVYGFRKDCSTSKGLRKMLDGFEKEGKPLQAAYSVDIKNFFPSVTHEQAYEVIRRYGMRMLHHYEEGPQLPRELVEQMAHLMADLCCLRERLPQGAATSPVIANMVGVRFDLAIRAKLEDHNPFSVYGRYADDVVLLSEETIPEKLRGIIINIIESCGFQIARHKVEYAEGKPFYKIWGLSVYPADEKAGLGLHFRLPNRMVEKMYVELRELTHTSDLPKKTDDFLHDKRIQKLLGRLAYANLVTKYGNHVYERSGRFCLPPKLAFAWEQFFLKHQEVLPPTAKGWFCFGQKEYTVRTEYVDVDSEIFSERIAKLCERKGYDREAFQQAMGRMKEQLLAKLQKTKGEDRMFFDTHLSKELNEQILEPLFNGKNPKMPKQKYAVGRMVLEARNSFGKKGLDQLLQAVLAFYSAIGELLLNPESSFQDLGMQSDLEEDVHMKTFLPAELGFSWHSDFRNRLMELENGEEHIRHLKWLFWFQEKQNIRLVEPAPNLEIRKPYLYFPKAFRRWVKKYNKAHKEAEPTETAPPEETPDGLILYADHESNDISVTPPHEQEA